MEDWVFERLSECLKFPVPDEMIGLVMNLKESGEIDDYFGGLLDSEMPEHRQFVSEFKKRVCYKNKTPAQDNAPRRNPLGLKQPKKKPDKYDKQKNQQAPSATEEAQRTDSQPHSITLTQKKKTKYVNLYSQDGVDKDAVMLKGRHFCECQATKHKLINNCLQCGRIICEQEGSGPCLFCGNLVCSEGETKLIESSSKRGDSLKKNLMQQQRPKGWEEAVAMRNRLLDYDRSSEKRTTVIDDESDYFKANSVWLSDGERKKLKKLEEEMRERKHASRLTQKITFDFAGRQVVEEASMTTEFEDEILREIANTCSGPQNTGKKLIYEKKGGNSEDCHPLLDVAPPVFDVSVQVRKKSGNSQQAKYDGVYSRVQDKELLEVSDMRNCMSMHQPWASLLVAGIKKHEGRPWYTSHRGRLWIASTAKPVDTETVETMEKVYKRLYNDDSIQFPSQYPSGCLLGCVLIQDCLPQEEYRKVYSDGESESPYVFICNDPQELPIRFPVRGEHKIYKLDENIHTAAVKALQRIAKLKAEEE